MRIISLIPARGGSKRFPRKNLAKIDGKTLVEIAVQQALRVFGEANVSTDSEEIARIVEIKANVIHRPDWLADDEAPTQLAVVHAAMKMGWTQDTHVCLLQPTSPQRTPSDIMRCIAMAYAGFQTYTHTANRGSIPNGAVYIAPVSMWAAGFPKSFCPDPNHLITMPESRSIDINTAEDFERVIRQRQAQEECPE